MLGSAGQEIMFVCVITALSVVTPYVFLNAAHLYVTVIVFSSTGEDHFRWPRESLSDWLGEGLVVLGVIVVSATIALIPVGILATALSLEESLIVGAVIAGLIAPIILCSVMAAPSKAMFFDPALIGRLFIQWKALAFVYLITTPFVYFTVGGVWLVIAKQNWVGVFVVAIALPPGLILHARAWGRLSWLALNYDRKRRKKKKAEPEDESDDAALVVELEPLDADDGAIPVNPAFTSGSERPVRLEAIYAEQRASELRDRLGAGQWIDPDSKPPTFDTALGQKILTFVLDVDNLLACLGLSIGCVVIMGLALLMSTV